MTEKKILGILGGLGPLASLDFLRTLYEYNRSSQAEQDYPNVLLHSLASVPDRTHALLNNGEKALEEALVKNLRALYASGASKIIICCFTSHTLIDRMPREIAEKIVSLVDLTARELMIRKKPSLLLASLGSYQRHVFRSTEEAMRAQDYIVVPHDEDKTFIHGLIYEKLKSGKDVAPVYESVKGLLGKYSVNAFIAGCTEFHMLSRYIYLNGITDVSFVDPLFYVAERLEEILAK